MPLVKVQLDDVPLSLMQDSISDNLQQLQSGALSNAQFLSGVVLQTSYTGQQTAVGHGLGRAPKGYIVVRNHSGTVTPIAWTQATLAGTWAHSGEPVIYKMDADGVVRFGGYATNVADPGNGSNWITGLPPSVYPFGPSSWIKRPVCYGQRGGTDGLFRFDLNETSTSAVLTLAGGTVAAGAFGFLLADQITWQAYAPPKAVIGDNQDQNPTPDRTLWLTSNGITTVDLVVF